MRNEKIVLIIEESGKKSERRIDSGRKRRKERKILESEGKI